MSDSLPVAGVEATRWMPMFARLWDSDLAYSFRSSPVAIVAAVVAVALVGGALLARWVAPHNPFDLATISLLDASIPPFWADGGTLKFPLGTDVQGRDVLSAVIYGMRISLVIGALSVALAMVAGVGIGLLSGYAGGRLEFSP